MMHNGTALLRSLFCFLTLTLLMSACVYPFESPPTYRMRFEGTVLHAGTSAPVANAEVLLWDNVYVEDIPPSPVWKRATTDATGRFMIRVTREGREYSGGTVRILPPTGSSLQPEMYRDTLPGSIWRDSREGEWIVHTGTFHLRETS